MARGRLTLKMLKTAFHMIVKPDGRISTGCSEHISGTANAPEYQTKVLYS